MTTIQKKTDILNLLLLYIFSNVFLFEALNIRQFCIRIILLMRMLSFLKAYIKKDAALHPCVYADRLLADSIVLDSKRHIYLYLHKVGDFTY